MTQTSLSDWQAKAAALRVPHQAFVDGKHAFDVVKDEGERLAERQTAGDLALFDDCQIEGVRRAVNALGALYTFEPITATPGRAYALGVRR